MCLVLVELVSLSLLFSTSLAAGFCTLIKGPIADAGDVEYMALCSLDFVQSTRLYNCNF